MALTKVIGEGIGTLTDDILMLILLMITKRELGLLHLVVTLLILVKLVFTEKLEVLFLF
jgi:hypothetical protein